MTRSLVFYRVASQPEHDLFGHSVVEAHVIDLQGEGTLLASTAEEQAGQARAVEAVEVRQRERVPLPLGACGEEPH